MKQFYFDTWSMEFAPQRECKKCPHRHNSLLVADNVTPNVLERFEVKYGWGVYSQKYPTIEVARQAIRVFCDYGYMFKKRYKKVSMAEYLELSMRFPIKWVDDKCFINNRLYAEIVQLF